MVKKIENGVGKRNLNSSCIRFALIPLKNEGVHFSSVEQIRDYFLLHVPCNLINLAFREKMSTIK